MNRAKKPMRLFRRYKNLSKDSKVLKYEIEKDGMTVVFSNNTAYRYTNQSADPETISQMKSLAVAGKGLGTFIVSKVQDRYLHKIR